MAGCKASGLEVQTTMSNNRMRLCLISISLFATLIALPSAVAQSGPTRPEAIVGFAPHPNDEVIGCAGIIQQALAHGARAKVVAITSGYGCPEAAAGVTYKAVDQVGPEDFFALSRLRQNESRNALEILGGKADDLIILGYPDGELGNLYESTDDKVIRQQFTKKRNLRAQQDVLPHRRARLIWCLPEYLC